MRRLIIAVAALAAAACSPEFDPASKIEKLRVLAIQAEPPEIDPAGIQTAALTSLVVRADYLTTTRTTTVLHLACVPVPGDAFPTFCEQLSNLADPAVRVAELARKACAPDPTGATTTEVAAAAARAPTLAGVEVCTAGVCGPATLLGTPLPAARIAVPAGFTFSPAAPADLAGAQLTAWEQRVKVARILGVQAVDLSFAVDATPDELFSGLGATGCVAGDLADRLAALWATREHVLSVKRVAIRGPESPNAANRNPSVGGIAAGAVTLDPAVATSLDAGKIELSPVLPAGAAGEPETYVDLDASGAYVETKTEEWVYSWFSTAGKLKDLHTRSTRVKPDEWTDWDAGPAKVVVVVRDRRGGTSWAVRDVVIK
jgi:hypothetical protein